MSPTLRPTTASTPLPLLRRVANANFYGSSGTKYTWIDITLVGG